MAAIRAGRVWRGCRHTVCTSINHVVCHGIPNDKPLRDGDIVNIDVTVILDGWHGDTSRMYPVGDVKRKAERLAEITYDAMMRGIAAVKPGATTGDIGHAIQSFAEVQEKCAVVRDFCGHGLGKVFHALPNIVHYGKPGGGIALKPGMFFTIEPMINLGGYGVKVLSDGWTAVTRDRSLSAQFEHSVGVGESVASHLEIVEAGAHRLGRTKVMGRPALSSWSALLDYCTAAMARSEKEEFRVLFLDRKNNLIADEVQNRGTVDHTPVYPREFIKRPLGLTSAT